MKKKDIKYRQGRSKQQVEENEKVAFIAYSLLLVVFTGLMFGLLIERLVG